VTSSTLKEIAAAVSSNRSLILSPSFTAVPGNDVSQAVRSEVSNFDSGTTVAVATAIATGAKTTRVNTRRDMTCDPPNLRNHPFPKRVSVSYSPPPFLFTGRSAEMAVLAIFVAWIFEATK
jgi:hypothetical protein